MDEKLRQDFPVITDDLLRCLAAMFPNDPPSPGTPLDTVWFNAGAASVVHRLRELQRWQNSAKAQQSNHVRN